MDSKRTKRPQQRKRIPFEEWQQLYGVKVDVTMKPQRSASLFDEVTPKEEATSAQESTEPPQKGI